MLASQILSGLLIKAFLFFSRYEAGTIIEFGIMIDYHTLFPPKKSQKIFLGPPLQKKGMRS